MARIARDSKKYMLKKTSLSQMRAPIDMELTNTLLSSPSVLPLPSDFSLDETPLQLLFCPGPVNVHPTVKEATIKDDICHRDGEFEKLMKSIRKNLLTMFEVKNPRAYTPVVITGSGSAANESVLSSVVGNKHILVLSNGEFGDRLAQISKVHNPNTSVLSFEWGTKMDIKAVEDYIKKNSVDVIAMVHHETSTGILNPIEGIGALTKKYDILFVVDTVSSAGAEKIDLEKSNIAFCSSATGKAIGAYPGLSFVIGKNKEFKKLAKITPRTMYLNLYNFYHYAKTLNQTPNTPSVQLFYAFNQALENINTEGIKKRRSNIKRLATFLRHGMRKMGLSFLVDEKEMSSLLTTVKLPEGISTDHIKSKLRERGIIVYDGKGPFKGKVFQVANIGNLTIAHANHFLINLKEVLDSFSDMVLPFEQPTSLARINTPLSSRIRQQDKLALHLALNKDLEKN